MMMIIKYNHHQRVETPHLSADLWKTTTVLGSGPVLSPGEYLRLLSETGLRLYEVEDMSPGVSVTLVELPSGTRVKVHERLGSRSLWRHALLAARIISEGPSGQPIVERASNINGYPSNWDSWVHQHCSPSELFRKFCII